MPQCLFSKENWFPRFIIIRREQGSSVGGDSTNEWFGFVTQIKRHLENETTKLKEIIDRSTDNTKKEVKRDVAEVKKEMKTGQEELKT
jgi:hemerythrin-like domain-containing protein